MAPLQASGQPSLTRPCWPRSTCSASPGPAMIGACTTSTATCVRAPWVQGASSRCVAAQPVAEECTERSALSAKSSSTDRTRRWMCRPSTPTTEASTSQRGLLHQVPAPPLDGARRVQERQRRPQVARPCPRPPPGQRPATRSGHLVATRKMAPAAMARARRSVVPQTGLSHRQMRLRPLTQSPSAFRTRISGRRYARGCAPLYTRRSRSFDVCA